jgi:hypothetical protein
MQSTIQFPNGHALEAKVLLENPPPRSVPRENHVIIGNHDFYPSKSPPHNLQYVSTRVNMRLLFDIEFQAQQRSDAVAAGKSSIKIGNVLYVAAPTVAKSASAIVFVLCAFFLVIGQVTGEQLVRPIVALAIGITALGLLGVAFVAEKRP